MIPRRRHAQIAHDLTAHASVALLGPRQVGKTTLAKAIADTMPSIYLDIEDHAERQKIADPVLFLDDHFDKLVVIDEIQNAPDLFASLRGIIDRRRRAGREYGQFLGARASAHQQRLSHRGGDAVICNPAGRAFENAAFRDDLVVDVGRVGD